MPAVIHTSLAPAAVGPYSQAIDLGDFIFCSGQIPLVPDTGLLAAGGIDAQTRQMFSNINAILDAAGLDLSHVVKTTVFMKDLTQFDEFNAIYAEYFPENPPARSCVEVSNLPKGALVECEVLARR